MSGSLKGWKASKCWNEDARRCSDCKEWKPIDSFYFDNQKQRFRSKCKQCTSDDKIRRDRRLKDGSLTLDKIWR